MSPLSKLLRAAMVLALAFGPRVAEGQKALVYCPVSIDATGCATIKTALTTAYPGGIDTGFDGTQGTVDLETVDLFQYSVVVVPSLADDSTAPYALLRDATVASKLKAALLGRRAFWSGTPDQGVVSTTRPQKDALIQNLAAWAGGDFATVNAPGLVVLQDNSTDVTKRYDWVQAIAGFALVADTKLASYSAVSSLTAAGNAVLTSNGSTLAYANMASMGFQTPSGAAGTSLDAVGKTGTGIGGQVVLITQSGANTGGAVVTTDRDDYAPGTPVVITGTGFGAGETVQLTLHEDPTIEPDFSFTATADQNGGFTFTGFTPDTLDVDVRFVLTATGQTSGRRAQTTFTDGGFVVKTSAGATITAATLIYPGTTNSCSTTPPPSGTVTGSLSITSSGVNFVIPNNNQFAKITIPLQSNEGGAYTSATAPSGGASIISNTVVGSNRDICIQSSNGSGTNLGTLTLTYGTAAVATTTTVTSSNEPSAFGQSVTFTATVTRTSGTGATPTGKVQFKIDGSGFGSQVTLSRGTASSSSIATLPVGAHSITADYTPDAPFTLSSGSFTQNVGVAGQTIAFGTISKKTFGDADFGISATASSQLPVSFAATGNCTVSGNQVSITAAGNCTITASQAGNASYAPATPVQQSFTIDPATATLAIDPTSLSATYNGNPHAAIVTTTPTGLAVVGVTYAGSATAPTNAGSYAVVAKLTNANYSATDATGTLTIAKATPSFTTVNIAPITYQAPTATISGTVTAGTLAPTGSVGITVSGTGGSIMGSATVDASGNFTTTVNTATLPANPAGYDVALDLPASQNFAQATDNTHKLIVNKAAQSITFTALPGKTYGDAPFAVSATSSSGLAVAFTTSGDCSATSSTITLTGAGSCTVHADQIGDGNYQPAPQVSQSFAIGKATAVINVAGFSGPYDGGPHGATGTATGVGGADLKASLSLGQSFTNVPGGTASWTFSGGANYKDDQGTVPITITPRAISIAADPQTKGYGDADPTLTYKTTSGSLISGDNFSGALTRVAGENVGTYAIQQGALTAGNNYAITYTGANLGITTRSISVTADPQTKVYGDPDPSFTYKITAGSLAFSDAFTGALAGDGNQGVGMHPIGQGTLALNANYVLTYIGAKLDITPRPITVTADGKTKVYGDDDPAFTAQVTTGNLVFSDGLSGALTRVAGENVGSYAINQGALTAGPNYTVTFVSGSLSITTRPIGITADVKTKVYGDPDPALTYQITSGSLAFTDKFTGSLDRAAGENVGNYAIQEGTVALNANYALTYAGANLSVTARPVAVTADAATKVYGDPDPTPFTYKITTGNLVNGDGFSGALARDPGTNVGSYDIVQGTLALSTNYALTYNKGSLSITPRPIGITADAQTKVYGDADPALTYKTTSGNLVSGDAFTGALTRATGEDVGPYGILQGTVTAGANYTLSYNGANLTITTRPITVTADAQTKTYGDPDPALTYRITSGNLVYGDVISGALSRAAGQTVGSYAIQQGNLAATTNYALAYAGASLGITPRPITLKPVAPNLVWTGAPQMPQYSLDIAGGSLGNGDALSVFTGAVYSPMSVTLVGTYTPTLSGAANGNYAVSYATGSFKVLDTTAPTGGIISLDPVGLGVSPKLVVNFTDVATGNSNIIAWKYSLDGVDQPTLSGSGTPSNTFTQQLPAFNTTDVVKVCASAEDAGTNWSAPVCALLAIYDPTAGFVTGGGWINSPIGAYVVNPSLTGKANFGFVSKYQKGANVPTGNTEFQFNEANLNFSSTNFQWLVIQGGTSAQFKGTGTINGKGSYNFMVTVVDGDAYNGTKKPDSFRMKITDLSGAVVYDNQIGQPDTALTPTQSTYLGGGSVVIHDK
jgi:hypothetical protein